MQAERSLHQYENIIFFDGYCALCNGVVSVIFALKAGKNFKYAPLQGKTAKELLSSVGLEIDSIVYYKSGKILIESEAAISIAEQLNWPYKAVCYAKYLPKRFNAWVYRWVAKNRYKIFGKRQECRIPTAKERAFFLP